MSCDLLCVNPADVSKSWPLARDLIRSAIERTGLSDFDDIEKEVLEGRQLLWLAISDHVEAAATTQLSGGVCTLVACSGHERGRWMALLAGIEKYAKAEDCKTMRIFGRKGWERVLDDYRVEHVVLEKAL